MRIDLHRHLEGSHSARALLLTAQRFDIRSPLLFDAAAGRFRSEAELAPALRLSGPTPEAMAFYRCIERARVAYVSPAAIGHLTALAFEEAAADSPDGVEMRVSLYSMTRTLYENEGLTKQQVWALPPLVFAERCRQVLTEVLAARDRMQLQTRVPMLVRLGLSRTFEVPAQYDAMGRMLAEYARALCGLDVLGILPTADPEPLQPELVRILEDLRRHVPDLTVHAGEFAGHASVDRTLALAPQGIGHGVHALQSDATLNALSGTGVTLEVCPTSNHLLIHDAVVSLAERRGAHPLVALQRAQVHCVLGSDDPVPMATDFGTEWAQAQRLGVDMARLGEDIARRWGQLPKPR